jgi:adenosylcobinamide kinase/adenosylcobinamide-phosphate guanylyltransferase
VLGGARSGKSRFALQAVSAPTGVFLATAEPSDADMARRIARHRSERGPGWRTIEEPRRLVATLAGLVGRADAVVVDCITVWVGNCQLGGDTDDTILVEADKLAGLIRARHWNLALVSNEVGEGVHPPTTAGLRFRDLLGLVNQRLAAAADRVVLMVAGLPLTVKDVVPSVHAETLQAP